MGYSVKSATADTKYMMGAQFVEVGASSLDIQSIKLGGVDPDGGAVITWWENGAYAEAYWVELDWDPDNPGWGDELNWEPIEKTFAAGEGFWITMPPFGVSNPSVTMAGEVALSDAATHDKDAVADTKYMVSNPLPTTLDISEVILDGVDPDGGAVITWWENGAYAEAYWVELDWDPDNPGWGDELNWEPIEKVFAAGEGFWITMPPFGVDEPKIKIANTVL